MPDYSLEAELIKRGFGKIAGVDEAGRGPLAGPVVVAAVVLPIENTDMVDGAAGLAHGAAALAHGAVADWPPTIRLDDSKRLSPKQRVAAFDVIKSLALSWSVKVVPAAEIDRVNILQATLNGMAAAVAGLKPAADFALVDGNQMPPLGIAAETVVKGDSRSNSIAAASILAKVVRDRMMAVYDKRYPGWGFADHKGYPTKAHREAYSRLGPSPIHRLTFRVKPL